MKAKEWRATAERLVRDVEHILEMKPLQPITDSKDMTIVEYKDLCEMYRRINAEAQVESIKVLTESFKKMYLNREFADDFDE